MHADTVRARLGPGRRLAQGGDRNLVPGANELRAEVLDDALLPTDDRSVRLGKHEHAHRAIVTSAPADPERTFGRGPPLSTGRTSSPGAYGEAERRSVDEAAYGHQPPPQLASRLLARLPRPACHGGGRRGGPRRPAPGLDRPRCGPAAAHAP